jgi:demethylmenaquinone methyltransferase/2-methoxy-6-polyprenyl-1,4-benzoquinol methylase
MPEGIYASLEDRVMRQTPLGLSFTAGQDRQGSVTALFDRTAVHYEWMCRVMSFGSGQLYRRKALVRAGLSDGMKVLDVATGTGLVAREAVDLAGNTRRVVGLDASCGMLQESQKGNPYALVQGLGETMPFRNDCFDFVSNGYGVRYILDLEYTFREYHRVLKPGGRLLLLEISRPCSRIGFHLARLYLGKLGPLITQIGTGSRDATLLMKHFWDSIANSVPPEVILAALNRSGFREATHRVLLGIFSEYIALK